MLKNKGFTFLEIMGAIAILGILATIGTIAVLRYIKVAEDQAKEENEKEVVDAAITYAISKDLYFKVCETEEKTACEHEIITVQYLIDTNFLKDNADKCKKNGEILIYMDSSYNFKTEFITENICN